MRALVFLIPFFLFSVTVTHAQSSKTDSLKKALRVAKNDTATVGLINILTYKIYMTDEKEKNEIGMYIDSAIRVAERTNYAEGNIKARFIAGNVFKNYGQTQKAEKYLLGALPYCKQTNNPSDYFKINHTLGSCFDEEGNYKLASEYFFIALGYAEKGSNKSQMANAYGGLGNLYASQGDFIKAISYQRKALTYRTQLNDKMRMSFSYVNLGNAYKNINKFDSAQYYYNKALAIQTSEKNTVGQAYSYTGIGNVYLKKGLPLASIDYFKRAYALMTISDDAEVRSMLLNAMGENYLQLNDLNTALDFLKKAEAFNLKSNRLPELKESYLNLAKVYRTKKDFEKAYDYFQKYSEIKDTLLNADVGKKISSLEYNYQIEQDKKITQLENEKIQFKHEAEVKKQRLIIWAGFVILIIVSLFSIFIFRQYKAKKAANLIINSQKTEIEKQHSELEEKQKEIVDSIKYAKRIQQTLMPSEKYIEKNLKSFKKS
ncbi:MAG: tetratricopeptide repeat protein [Sphingobacteriaceae bacterium]|nr:tetratricopeptide repeat protein [Sphingobacteriaceae bacterium]